MSALADAVRAMDRHWRYADTPRAFKRWFAKADWKARRARRRGKQPPFGTIDHRSRRLNAMLSRHGRPDLHVTYPGAQA